MFVRHGSSVFIAPPSPPAAIPTLPPSTFTVRLNREGQFYLEDTPDLDIGHKVYGRNNQLAERIMETFVRRERATGVLLGGLKGTGKTLLTKQLSIMGRAQGWPTILVTNPFTGDAFNKFIQTLPTAIVLFDEFEKTYYASRDDNPQNQLLTLFDGLYPSNKLYVLTVNNTFGVNTNMINRPGRILYAIDYAQLDADTIREYAIDKLDDKSGIDDLVKIGQLIPLTFDMLSAIIEEMNRYKENAGQALRYLNVRLEGDKNKYYKASMKSKNPDIPQVFPYNANMQVNMYGDTAFSVYLLTKKDEAQVIKECAEENPPRKPSVIDFKNVADFRDATFNLSNISNILEDGTFVVELPDYTLYLKPPEPTGTFSFANIL